MSSKILIELARRAQMMMSACTLKDLAMRSCVCTNKDLICYSERELACARAKMS